MYLKQGIRPRDFIGMVKKCKGEVFLKSDQGDVLNLKSTLSQYVFATMEDEADLKEYRIECTIPEDYQVLEECLESNP